MKPSTKLLLEDAMEYCEENDKSTAFMIEYMKDVAKVDHNCVIRFIEKKWEQTKEGKDDGH